jgi:hypothetical protein
MSSTRREFVRIAGGGIGAVALAPLASAFAQTGSDPLIVVSNGGDANNPTSMTLIHPRTLDVLLSIEAPFSFSFPATRWAFRRDTVWGGAGTGVHGFNISSAEAIAAIDTGSRQNYTELTPSGDYVITAARYAHKVVKMDARPGTPDLGRIVGEATLYEGAQPCDMTMLQDGSYCFTPDRGGDTVSVFAVEPFAHAASVPLERLGEEPLEPYMATVSPRGDFLFVENARGDGSESILDVRDPTQPTEVARLTQADGLGLGAITSEFTPDGQFNCIICRNSSDLTVVNVDQLAVVGRVAFPEGSNPVAGTFTPSGDRFFVPLPGRDAVAVVSVPAFEVEQLVPVGPRPLGAVYLENPVPQRQGLNVPLGNSLEAPRVWPADCPDPCCGVIT